MRFIPQKIAGVFVVEAQSHRDERGHFTRIYCEREFADAGPLPDEQMSRAQDRRLILGALAALDLDRRAVFVMHELDGFSMPEIAAALSAPLNTCYSRLRLAREAFASAVRPSTRWSRAPTARGPSPTA